MYILNGGAVSWCSCKQSVVAGSTCEAVYMAASEAAQEAIWVKEFFEGVKAKIHPPPEEKVDPVKAKRTIDALRKPPKSPPRTNY